MHVPRTGHTIRGLFLDYWRANGSAAVYGNPVSEPFTAPNGYYSQVFERGVFQYRPEFLWSEEPIVRLMPIHDLLLGRSPDQLRREGRRQTGGGYQRATAWRPYDPSDARVARIVDRGGRYFPETGHTIRESVVSWYDHHLGAFYLGFPMSEPMSERGGTIQFFEGAILEISEGEVRLASVGELVSSRLGVDTAPVDQGGLTPYDEALFAGDAAPATEAAIAAAGQTGMNYLDITGDTGTPGRKWIEVGLAEQRMWAYQGQTVIAMSLVSTGIAPNTTSTGLFHLRLKYPLQTMKGYTDESGLVLGFGDPPPGTIPYEVEDVPNVMYFSLLAEAFHGAYWHNNFGTPMSHGCVNFPLEVAAFMYGWAPLGTMVVVRA